MTTKTELQARIAALIETNTLLNAEVGVLRPIAAEHGALLSNPIVRGIRNFKARNGSLFPSFEATATVSTFPIETTTVTN